MELEKNAGLRAQKPPLPGKRPISRRSPRRRWGLRRRLEPRWSMACRPLPCLYWQGRQARPPTVGLSPSSSGEAEEEGGGNEAG